MLSTQQSQPGRPKCRGSWPRGPNPVQTTPRPPVLDGTVGTRFECQNRVPPCILTIPSIEASILVTVGTFAVPSLNGRHPLPRWHPGHHTNRSNAGQRDGPFSNLKMRIVCVYGCSAISSDQQVDTDIGIYDSRHQNKRMRTGGSYE